MICIKWKPGRISRQSVVSSAVPLLSVFSPSCLFPGALAVFLGSL